MLDVKEKYPEISKRNEKLFCRYFDKNFQPKDLNAILKDFQNVGVKFIFKRVKKHKNILLCDEQGLGKTIQALATSLMLKNRKGVRSVIIVCPSFVKQEWARMVNMFTELSYVVVNGKDYLNCRAFYNIISYDMFWRLGDKLKECDMIILDEFHYIKSYKAKRTEAVMNSKYKYGLYLSGTPILNNIHELFTILNKIDESNFPSFVDFRNEYCKVKKIKVYKWYYNRYSHKRARRTFYIDKIIGPKNIKKLQKLIKPYFLRRLKKEVLTDLPSKLHQHVFVNMGGKQRKIYDDVKKGIIKDANGSSTLEIKNKFMKLHQICQGIECDTNAKLDFLETFVKDHIYDDHKAIIVSPYIDGSNLIYEKFKDEYGSVLVNSETDSKDDELAKYEFQENDKIKLYIGTIKKNHLGLTLTSADYVIFVGTTFVPKINEQMEDRAHRIGQHRTVNIVRILTTDTMEERVEEILQGKRSIFDKTIEKINFKKLSKRKILTIIKG